MPAHDKQAIVGLTAPDPETAGRWLEGQRRGRMLNGTWRQDLERHLQKELSPTRRKMRGKIDAIRNLFRSTVKQLAVLYHQVPIIHNDDAVAVLRMEQITNNAGMWQLAISLQRQVLGLREGAYRFDWTDDGLLVRIVPAYCMWADSDPDRPDVPVVIHEYRIRQRGDDYIWTRDVLSIEDPDNPVYRVETADGKLDLTEEYLGGPSFSGENYPYRFSDGTAYLPYSLYHAQRTGQLWDPYEGIELVDGSLVVAGMWTQWRSIVRDSSHPQRYGVNVEVEGGVADPNTGLLTVESDPTTMINFKPKHPGQGTQVGQFQPGGDPVALGNAIRDLAADIAAEFDISPADIKRTHTDARSGYAIEISRDGQRSAQRQFEPQFQRGDSQSLAIIAALANDAEGLNMPESGWSVAYRGLPLSIEERKLLMEDHKMRAELGVTSKPHLLAQLEGITEDQSRDMLRKFQSDNIEFQSVGLAPQRAAGMLPNPSPNPSEDD